MSSSEQKNESNETRDVCPVLIPTHQLLASTNGNPPGTTEVTTVNRQVQRVREPPCSCFSRGNSRLYRCSETQDPAILPPRDTGTCLHRHASAQMGLPNRCRPRARHKSNGIRTKLYQAQPYTKLVCSERLGIVFPRTVDGMPIALW